ncbi:GNAT family N-acetyltransferase [Kutzneria sp. CA-103260]|uniref:GNAT family N-acetyltransferase n=1 Tax=Kutzneria sp. CA-103260 TaxID=2802641 RepID=UPI001BA61D13|nr:GNAT family N-acetyltransferase [Kutzneria sp. CA-103260]
MRPDEAPALVAAGGQAGYIADRLARQAADHGVLLAAWLDGRPVGCVYLWLEDAEEEEIRRHLPDIPLITHLEVFEPDRNQGYGKRLVRAGEQELHRRGLAVAALAVEYSNKRAVRFYERLGYQDWGREFVDCNRRDWHEDGTFTDTPEKCYVFTKSLTDAPQD